MFSISGINPEPHCIGVVISKIFVHAPSICMENTGPVCRQARGELQLLTSRGILEKFSSTQARERKKQKRLSKILIFMDVFGGFAFATVAAPGAISLKKVSTRVEITEVRFWISGGLCTPLIPIPGMAPGRTHGSPGQILLGTPQQRGVSPGSVLYHRSVF